MPQELSAPSGLLLNIQFFLPSTKGRIAFSHALLSGVRYGDSRYLTSFSHSSRLYPIALPSNMLGGTSSFCFISHALKSLSTRHAQSCRTLANIFLFSFFL